MRLAIHHSDGSFSNRWEAYCDKHQIPYERVNCLATDVIHKLAFVDGLLWHWSHQDPGAQLAARQLLMAAEKLGIAVFPNTATCWHFDDKTAQKYLLESVGAPLVPTYVFYDQKEALQWIDATSFPKVFKLRRGAGSQNVRLLRTRDEARVVVKQAFSNGFRALPPYWNDSRRRYRAIRRSRDLLGVLQRLPQALSTIRRLNNVLGREIGYAYFQDFIPDNSFDTRVTIIGNRGFAYVRKVRPGDFRASGSGNIDYDPEKINLQCVETAFEVARKIGSQSMAFDFVLTPDNQPMIVEVSYCYIAEFVHNCGGHWDRSMTWNAGHLWPEEAILTDLLQTLARRESIVPPRGKSLI